MYVDILTAQGVQPVFYNIYKNTESLLYKIKTFPLRSGSR